MAAWWFNGFVFRYFEVSPGINLVYWPHGVRILVILLFGFSGALGLTLAALFVAPSVYPNTPWLWMLAPLIGGFAPYAARRIILVEFSGESAHLTGLRPETLISIVSLSALLNSGGHILVRYSLDYGENYASEFCAMLAGDTLGALSFLYGIKFCSTAIGSLRRLIR